MRLLIGWDDPGEAETIGLVMEVDEGVARIEKNPDEFRKAAEEEEWDVIFLALSFPTTQDALALFNQLHATDVPVVGVWKPDQIVDLARFISAGLHSHLMRDAEGNFIFLMMSMAEAAYASVQAQRARILAERLREELDSVRRLQESVIPNDLPQTERYKIAARYEPAAIRIIGSSPVAMAGGDYYDIFELDNESLVLLVGDASGHGVKACMSIMTMHTLIRMIRTMRHHSTAEFVAEINRRLCSNDIVQDGGGFITLLYSTLNMDSNELHWTTAGAPMPLLQNLATNEIKRLGTEKEGGLPLAIEDDWDYVRCHVEIPANSRLLIYTDGLEEAFPPNSSDDRQFGMEGIITSLKASVELPVDEALAKLFDDSHDFTNGSGRADDTSIVLVERTL